MGKINDLIFRIIKAEYAANKLNLVKEHIDFTNAKASEIEPDPIMATTEAGKEEDRQNFEATRDTDSPSREGFIAKMNVPLEKLDQEIKKRQKNFSNLMFALTLQDAKNTPPPPTPA